KAEADRQGHGTALDGDELVGEDRIGGRGLQGDPQQRIERRGEGVDGFAAVEDELAEVYRVARIARDDPRILCREGEKDRQQCREAGEAAQLEKACVAHDCVSSAWNVAQRVRSGAKSSG